jgi:hypothetical protein
LKRFTYLDYIKAIHILKTNDVSSLEEEERKYLIDKAKTEDDKIIEILRDKKEIANFLNNFLNLKNKIESEELIQVRNGLIEKQNKNKHNNIIYKQKNKEIFFLIQHEENINKKLSYNMLNFCMEILQEWTRNKKSKTTSKKPIVIPIVIYTGKEKIHKQDAVIYKKIGNYTFENFEMKFEYNLINIKNMPKQYLIEQKTIFSNNILLEK